MTKERETGEEEGHYIKELKYNASMKLHSDAHLLKTLLKAGSCYPRLLKEIEVKNDGIPHRLLSLIYKFLVR